MINVTTENKRLFTDTKIDDAYGAEVSLFLHCHLRGYDKAGDGNFQNYEYYDKYGSPMSRESSWEEGYHVIEKKLADYYNHVKDKNLPFPLIAGMGGGVHLYKPYHGREGDEPWNCTGWIPRQRRWLSQGKFFSNRYFLGLRGNEIQNNLWDYHPHNEGASVTPDELEYSQYEPNDRYKGGYWFQYQPFGRYLHIIALKSPDVDQETNKCQRYNYIVHPLAYRSSIDTIPDNSVDAMQWCIINMPEEPHFGVGKDWGDKCHGLEIFNDFTFFHSYQPIEDGGPNNGELGTDITHRSINKDATYYYYFNTYPLEFGEFLLDSALARGVYYHTMAANDAFYERNTTEVACSDPKGHLHNYNRKCDRPQDPRTGVKKGDPSKRRKTEAEKEAGAKLSEIASFTESLPYNERTVFGFVTMFDPRQRIKQAVFEEKDGISFMGLEAGENLTLEYLIKGRYYADTGVWELFDYDTHTLPYKIFNQPDPEELCHEISNDMELVFTFLPVSKRNDELVWRYTVMVEKVDPTKANEVVGIETTHGYFKLDLKAPTKLDLRSGFEKSRLMWLYFTAFKPQNPQRRAWLHAIRGPAFGKPRLCARMPPLKHRIQTTTKTDNTIVPDTIITPTPVTCEGSLDFAFGKAKNDHDIYVYSMQVMPHQQDLTTQPVSDRIKESSDHIPPRIMQNVHGYFNPRVDHPTRLNLSASWDSMTVQDPVLFYIIDGEKGVPRPFAQRERPTLFGQNPSPLTSVPSFPSRPIRRKSSIEPLSLEESSLEESSTERRKIARRDLGRGRRRVKCQN